MRNSVLALFLLSGAVFGQGTVPGSSGGGLGPVVLTGTPSTGYVPTATSTTTATWQAVGAASVTETAIANAEYCPASGTNTLTCSTTTTYMTMSAGYAVRVLVANINTGAVTLNVNSTGAAAITKNGTTALTGGELVSGGAYYLVYDGTEFQIQAIYKLTSVAAHNGSYVVLTGDYNKILTSNTTAAYTLAQAGTAGFAAGWSVTISNVGASGNITVTTTTSVFYGNGGATSVGVLLPGTAMDLVSDGTNWLVKAYTSGPIIVTGAVRSNGAGTLTQAACADLSNAGTGCSATNVALTGADINTSNQVTVTHLASALPVGQGGTGITSGTAGKVLGGATPSPVTVTSAYVDSSIALTGADINTSSQVTVTHLAGALPVNQGGTGTVSTLTGLVRGNASAMTATELSGDATTSGSNAVTVARLNGVAFPTSATVVGSNGSAQPVAATLQGNGSKVQLSTGSTTTSDCVKYDANGNTVDSSTPCLPSITASQTYYILPSGSGTTGASTNAANGWNGNSTASPTVSDANNCTAVATPCLTLAGAVAKFAGQTLASGVIITLNVADGTNTGSNCLTPNNVIINNPMPGNVEFSAAEISTAGTYPPSYIHIVGSTPNSTAVTVAGSNGCGSSVVGTVHNAITVMSGAALVIDGFNSEGFGQTTSNAYTAVFAAEPGGALYCENMTATQTSGGQSSVCSGFGAGATLRLGGTMTIGGSTSTHIGAFHCAFHATCWTWDPLATSSANTVVNISSGTAFTSSDGAYFGKDRLTATTTAANSVYQFANSGGIIWYEEAYTGTQCPSSLCMNETNNATGVTWQRSVEGGQIDADCTTSTQGKCTATIQPMLHSFVDIKGWAREYATSGSVTQPFTANNDSFGTSGCVSTFYSGGTPSERAVCGHDTSLYTCESAAQTTPASGFSTIWCDSGNGNAVKFNQAGTAATPLTVASTPAAGSILTAIGTNGQVSATTGIVRSLSYALTAGTTAGSANALPSNATGYLTIPFACTINAWDILVDTGTATVKTWRVNGGTALPTSGNSISTSGVAISTGTRVRSTTVTDFTSTAISAGDTLAYTVTASSGSPTMLTFTLECTQTVAP